MGPSTLHLPGISSGSAWIHVVVRDSWVPLLEAGVYGLIWKARDPASARRFLQRLRVRAGSRRTVTPAHLQDTDMWLSGRLTGLMTWLLNRSHLSSLGVTGRVQGSKTQPPPTQHTGQAWP